MSRSICSRFVRLVLSDADDVAFDTLLEDFIADVRRYRLARRIVVTAPRPSRKSSRVHVRNVPNDLL